MFLAMTSVGSVISLLFCGQVLSYQVDETIPPDNQTLSLNSLQVPHVAKIENFEELIANENGEPCGLQNNKTCTEQLTCMGYVGRRPPGAKGNVKRGTCQPRRGLGHTCGYQKFPHPNTQFQSFLGECEDEYACKDNECKALDARSLSSCTRKTCTVHGEKCVPFKETSAGGTHHGCIWGKSWGRYGYWCATDTSSSGVYDDWDWCPVCGIGGDDCCTENRRFGKTKDRCLDKHGDCDNDQQCGHRDLTCGTDNCQGFGLLYDFLGGPLQDCCYDNVCDVNKGFCTPNSSGKCVKTEGQLGCCIFPFRCKGVLYHDCTRVDKGDHHLWCATQLNKRENTDLWPNRPSDDMWQWHKCYGDDH